MKQWYVVVNGGQTGPYAPEQISQQIAGGTIRAQDLVWSDGMADWLPAERVPELMPAIAGRGPALAMPMNPGPGAIPIAGAPPMAGGPGMLNYATPAAVVAKTVSYVPQLRPDNGPFKKIGSQFNTGISPWVGRVIASPQAIYMVKKAKQATNGTAYAVGGIAGMLIAAAASKGTVDDTRTCTVADLPPAVQSQVDPKGKFAAKDVIVIPKETISRIKVGGFNNIMKLSVGGYKMTVTYGIFSGGGIRRFLTDGGWILNTDLVPAVAPPFGHSFGRAEAVAPKATHPMLRVLYVILAVGLILLVIFLNVMRSTR